MKKLISIFCLVFVLATVLSLPVGAAKTYQTYTYSIDGYALHSPDAYTPVKNVNWKDTLPTTPTVTTPGTQPTMRCSKPGMTL